MSPALSLARLWAVVLKEFIQMRRDRLTFAMMIGIPLIQLTLFGFAINADPKGLPLALRLGEETSLTRSLHAALVQTGYFRLSAVTASEREAERLLATGEAQFVLDVPAGFSRRVWRGESPALLVEADATDPSATGNALAALAQLPATALREDLKGPLARPGAPPPFELRIHRRYNPEGISQYNIVPGLMGVILTMTMIMMTALAVTREHERGTMENLLAMPTRPLEVMLGKILPYILIGYTQVAVILLAARYTFAVPMLGSLPLLLAAILVFILANLSVGIMFSALARNQTQAMQMSFFFFLPSILLSGFMFPFRGMPAWAQIIGEVLPLTHFLRIVRGILLKGNGFADIWGHTWPLLLFLLAVLLIGMTRYRQTLD
ncbi:MAG: ABC transporter permease [Gammaproteobacteria bacterium]|nr:ABC transporter permease [Gammaproteobacteria bacterium]